MLRFKKGFEDTEIHIPGKRLIINRYNLNDPQVQSVLKKFPRYAHNFEEVKNEETGIMSVQSSSFIEEEPETSTGTTSIVEEQVVLSPEKPAKNQKSSSSKAKGQGENKK
jgi:hypothetical protein